MLRKGWYSKTEWMTVFRPDGRGHILISDGVRSPEDIAFDEVVCDRCNADAGAKHEDGSEGRIYFDGSDSLCEACGTKAAAQEGERRQLQEVRETLRARGWPAERVAALSEDEVRAIDKDWEVDRAAGIPASKIAENLRWDICEAVYFCGRVLEEVNEHRLAKLLFDSLEDEGPVQEGK